MRSDLILVLGRGGPSRPSLAKTFRKASICILLRSNGWYINRPITVTLLTRRVVPNTEDKVIFGLATGYSRVRGASWYCKRALQSKSREDEGKGGELHVDGADFECFEA